MRPEGRDGRPLLFIEEGRRHRIFRKRLQGKRRNKFGRVVRHDDKDFVSLFDEQAGELGGLIGGD